MSSAGCGKFTISEPMPRGVNLMVSILLFVHAGLLIYSASWHTPTFNEQGHLPAGISHLLYGRFDLYRVNPPLVRIVAASPTLAFSPKLDWKNYPAHPSIQSQLTVGIDFSRANESRTLFLFLLARLACVPFSLIGGYVCFRWASELFGFRSGIVALILWTFSPYVLGHGALIMPDIPAASLAVATGYVFYRYITSPSALGAFFLGVVLGLAQLTKFTLLVLYPILAIYWGWVICSKSDQRERCRSGVHLMASMLVSLCIINLGYLYDGAFQVLSALPLQSKLLSPLSGTWLGHNVPIPLPQDYVLGIDQQWSDFESTGLPCYLGGQWKDGGWWYFYLYGLALKTELGVIALFALALLRWAFVDGFSCVKRYWLLCAIPLSIVILVSSKTAFTIHLRYVFAALPFLLIIASSLFATRRPVVQLIGWGFVSWAAFSSLGCYPHSISYFNELAGGPENGHRHLIDSNCAWGQDLLLLKDWKDRHPDITELHVATFGWFDPALIGVGYRLPPFGPAVESRLAGNNDSGWSPPDGWYVIDVNHLHGSPLAAADGEGAWVYPARIAGGYSYFNKMTPVDRIGYSMLVYHVVGDG